MNERVNESINRSIDANNQVVSRLVAQKQLKNLATLSEQNY